MEPNTDAQLVYLYLKKGEEQALEELVARYLPLIYGYVRNYTGSEEHASDITQEVFIKAWKHLKSFDQSKQFRTWIFTIAKRTAIDWLRKKNALPFSMMTSEDSEQSFAESLADAGISLAEQLMQKEEQRQLAGVMAQLPENYHSVIALYHNDELNFREIAERLQEPLNTIKSRYRRGIARLKRMLL